MAFTPNPDYAGYLCLNPGNAADPIVGAAGLYVPVTSLDFDDNLQVTPILTAQNRVEALNWSEGVVAPSLRVSTYGFPALMGFALLEAMLGLGGNTYRSTTTGYLTKVGGNIQWKIGGNVTEWSQWMCDSWSVTWSEGAPLSLSMVLRLLGDVVTSPTAINATILPAYGEPWQSQGVSYDSTLSEVLGGTLSFSHGLEADYSTPATRATNLGRYVPNRYFNGPLSCSLAIRQYADSQTQVGANSGAPASLGSITVQFTDPATPATLDMFTLRTLQPSTQRSLRLGNRPPEVLRTYVNHPTDNAAASVPSVTLANS